MSADNGIYILNLNDQCRVITASAIDNIYYTNDSLNLKMIYKYFRNAKQMNKLEALEHACKIELTMQQDNIPLEYGIRNIYVPELKWTDIELSV